MVLVGFSYNFGLDGGKCGFWFDLEWLVCWLIVSATGVRVLLNANFNGLDDCKIINYSNSAFGVLVIDH